MWAIVFPFCVAAWLFLFAAFGFRIPPERPSAEGWRPVRRGLRWVCYLSVGYGSLFIVVCFPIWFHWARLQLQGVPVYAKVLKCSQEYDPEWSRQFTRVTYEFEAEVNGQRRAFQREGELRGVHLLMVPGRIQVVYDPVAPSDSRMVQESIDARDALGSVASFLVIGVASFLLSRKLSYRGDAFDGDRGKA